MLLFVRLNRRKKSMTENKKILIVISSWKLTPVPYLTLVYGKLLQMLGVEVEVLHLAGNFSRTYIGAILENSCLRLAIYLSGMRPIEKKIKKGIFSSQQLLKNYAKLNTIWQLKSENSNSHNEEELRQLSELENFNKQLSEYSLNRYDFVFTGGGVTGPSGLVYEVCKQQGIQICTFDSSTSEKMLFCCNGRAPKLDDLPNSLSLVHSKCAGESQYLTMLADREIKKRVKGIDIFKYQRASSVMENKKFDIGIFMNSTWDGAVLGSNLLFDGNLDWLNQTLNYIIKHTNHTVIVRQHPAEAHAHMRANVNYSKELASFLNNERVRFIKADERVNSYSILKNVRSVIFSTSTIGLEAGIFKKPLLTPSESYITKANLISVPNTTQEYFEAINTLPKVKPTDSYAFKELYALSQNHNWIHSILTCNSILRWWRLKEEDLLRCNGIRLILLSAMQNQPISYLQFIESGFDE